MKTATSAGAPRAKRAPAKKAPPKAQRDDYPEDGYAQFESTFHTALEDVKGALFTTSASPDDLWAAYLSGIPEEHRQHYVCHSCKRFIERFGGLVTIDTEGNALPAFWRNAPPFFAQSAENVRRVIIRSAVTGVHVCADLRWGTPQTGEWTHLSVPVVPAEFRYTGRKLSDSQRAAELIEEHGMLLRALQEYSMGTVEQAARVLASGAIYRPEKARGVADWFLALHAALKGKKGRVRDNIIWNAVAGAPVGFCHVKSTVISTLLDDIVAGLPFESIKARFAEKMNPLQYQRPTAPPSGGNIDSAQKLMAKLGTASALPRRFARLEDLKTFWTPAPAPDTDAPSGLFEHLRPREPKPPIVNLPPTTMTLAKFRAEVLPTAKKLELHIGHTKTNYAALVTAADPDAPVITCYGSPVSWFMFYGGSSPSQWNLHLGWVNVTALVDSPTNWEKPLPQHGKRIFFILEGCRPAGPHQSGGMFPEFLHPDYREIRSTLEAYYQNAPIAGEKEATACGLAFSGEGKTYPSIRVDGDRVYTLDRWD